jgi:hypothetical protein
MKGHQTDKVDETKGKREKNRKEPRREEREKRK